MLPAGTSPGNAPPPPPRNGLAIRPNVKPLGPACGLGNTGRRVRRAGCQPPPQNRGHHSPTLTASLIQSFANHSNLRLKLCILRIQSLLSVLQQRFQTLNPLVSSNQFAFSNRHILLQRRVLLHQLCLFFGNQAPPPGQPSAVSGHKTQGGTTNLALNERELIKIAGQELHLALLRFAVATTQHIVVLLARLVERDFQFNDLGSPWGHEWGAPRG